MSVFNLTSTKSTYVAGDLVNISFEVANQSATPANYALGVYLSFDLALGQWFDQSPGEPFIVPDDIVINNSTYVLGGIGANETQSIQLQGFSYQIPEDVPSGSYNIFVWVDNRRDYLELNEDDNLTSIPVTVEGIPDLKFNSFTTHFQSFFPFVPQTFAAGATIAMSCTVKNNDDHEAAPTSMLGYYLSTDNIFDPSTDRLLDDRNVPALNPGQVSGTISRDVQIPFDVTPGNYWIYTYLDRQNSIREEDETNNATGFEIAVSAAALADLSFLEISDLTPITEGEAITASTVRIRNSGGTATPPDTKITVILSQDLSVGPGDHEILNANIGQTINPNQTLTLNNFSTNITPVEFTNQNGSWNVFYILNETGAVSESNGNNNVLIKTITINNSNPGGGGSGTPPFLEPIAQERDLSYFDLSNESFKVFPNPATEVLNLQFNEKANRQVQMISVSGAITYHQQLTNAIELSIDVSQNPKGMYIIRVISENGQTQFKKVLIQKK